MKPELMYDFEIRKSLRSFLFAEASSCEMLISEEFGCKEARADIAVISDLMHCYEIKSGRDSLTRLARQIPAYGAIFDRVTIVTEAAHLARARSIIPSWWGILEAKKKAESVLLREVRKPRENRTKCNAKLARMLWKREAYSLLRERGSHEKLRLAPVEDIWQAVADLPTSVIADAVRRNIMQRGGSGSRPQLLRNDATYPIGSMK